MALLIVSCGLNRTARSVCRKVDNSILIRFFRLFRYFVKLLPMRRAQVRSDVTMQPGVYGIQCMRISLLVPLVFLEPLRAEQRLKRDGYQPIRPSLPPTVQSDSHSEVRHGDVHINVGTIQQHAENVKQIQENLAKKSFSQPHIEFTNPEVRPRWIKPYGGLVKETPEPHSENHTEMPVMLARFYYKDEPNVPPEIKVTAKIAIADPTGKPIKARYDGAWDEFTDSEYRRFATAQTRALIVALTPKMHGIMTWGFGRNAKGFDPDCEALHGEAFLLAVDLIGKSEGEIVLQKPLKFRLTIDPPDLRLED